jgi:hypothetical protein
MALIITMNQVGCLRGVKSSTNSTAKRKAVFTFDTTSINSSVDTDSSYDFINDDFILSHTDPFGLSSEFKHKRLLRCRELICHYIPEYILGC